MIIELNGLPGCGKTTLKRELMKEAMLKNYVIIGVDEFRGKNKNKLKKIILKLNRTLLPLNPQNIKITALLIRAILLTKKRTNISANNFYEKIISIMYIVYLYSNYCKSNHCILTDEGIIQSLTSAKNNSYIDETLFERILKIFFAITPNYQFVNCNCTPHESEERIIKRSRHDSAIDSLRGDKLSEYINEYNENLLNMREKIKVGKVVNVEIEGDIKLEILNILESIKR